jgi:hypothetical protein
MVQLPNQYRGVSFRDFLIKADILLPSEGDKKERIEAVEKSSNASSPIALTSIIPDEQHRDDKAIRVLEGDAKLVGLHSQHRIADDIGRLLLMKIMIKDKFKVVIRGCTEESIAVLEDDELTCFRPEIIAVFVREYLESANCCE